MSPGVSAEVLAIAETLNLCLPPAPGSERVVTPGWAAFVGAERHRHHNVVQRFRLAPGEVEQAVAHLRAFFRSRDRDEVTWEVGPSSTPDDLVERLLAQGMTPDDEPVVAGMVLSQPLPETGTDVTVAPVTDFAGFRKHFIIYRRCFGVGRPEATEEEIVADYERRRGLEDHVRRYLAFAGGEAVAAADAIFMDSAVALCGGATLPEARAKGAYRALLAARWHDALARGTPVLVVQAGTMSRPILERLGFETVARLRVLVDRLT